MLLATHDLAAATQTLLYEVPAGKRAAISVNLCARTGAPTVRLALTTGAPPEAANWIEYDTALSAGSGGVLGRSGIVLGAGQQVYARASAAGVSAAVWGIEEVL